MKHPKTFDIYPADRATYVRRPLRYSALDPQRIAVHTVGQRVHGSFRAFSDWLRGRK